jgi:D-arabinose 5-phosphate isomerase GutQ
MVYFYLRLFKDPVLVITANDDSSIARYGRVVEVEL